MQTIRRKIQVPIRRINMALCAILFFVFGFPSPAQARNVPADSLPTLERFIEQVANGDANTLRGVYIPSVLALPVAQQPPHQTDYISPMSAELTEFRMAQKTGNVGLLAHNYLAGRHFFLIEIGSPIMLVYGNRRVETFIAQDIRKYEELYNGMYKDLETLEDYRIGEIFQKMYGGARHLTLQTCIEKDGNWNWGRLFVIALPQETENARAETTTVPPPPPPPTDSFGLGWTLTRRFEKTLASTYNAKPYFFK